MIKLRKSHERGKNKLGWLETYYTFSFSDYFDPEHMGFETLRVINDDKVQPAGGFPTHPHRNMEIITYILEGTLAHKDSIGSVSTLGKGEVQVMTAGQGIAHSEFNPSDSETLHLLQIWIEPAKTNLPASYGEKRFDVIKNPNQLITIASRDEDATALKINQDAKVIAGFYEAGKNFTYDIASGRSVWFHLARGKVKLNDELLDSGGGAGIQNESQFKIEALEDSEFLIFDLAPKK